MHHDIYLRQWQCTMKLLLVTESPEIFTDIITLIITVVTAQTSNFSNSTSSADLSMALLILLQRLHYCVTFHRPCLFRNFATWRRGPSKIDDAMCDNPPSCLKMITLTEKEILLLLWSVTQFFTSTFRSGHFAACVQNGVYSSLISIFLPLAMSTHV